MSISATEGVTSTAGLQSLVSTTSSSSTGTSSTSSDKDMFMQLLVAQLKYQDPMNPADTSQFLSQTAQFNALQAMQDVATQTTSVLNAQMAFGASSLVGKNVTYALTDGTTGSGSVDGVSFEAAGPVLDVGGVSVPLVDVQSVGNTSSGASTSSSTDSSATQS